MKKESKERVCKNKNCGKVLPEGYKHRYCEACRNKHVDTAKNVLKGVATTALAIVSVVAVVATGGRINPKE